MLDNLLFSKILARGNYIDSNSRFYIVYFIGICLISIGHLLFGVQQIFVCIDSYIYLYNLVMGFVQLIMLGLHMKGKVKIVIPVLIIDLLICAWIGMDFYGPESASYLYVVMSVLAALVAPARKLYPKVIFSIFACGFLYYLFVNFPFDNVYNASPVDIKVNFISNVTTILIVVILINLVYVTAADDSEEKLVEENKKVMDQKTIIEANNLILQQQLEMAKQIQKSFIPSDPPKLSGVSLWAIYKPMLEVGGDYYDFIVEDDRLGIFISDVSGHGLSAAFITTMVKTLVDTSGNIKMEPSLLLNYINNKIMDIAGGNFLTAFYSVVDIESRTMVYARGGHNNPLLVRGNNVSELTGNGILLGAFRDIAFESRTLNLEKNDKLLFYTDGLVEGGNNHGGEYGKSLEIVLKKYAPLPVKDFVKEIYREMMDFNTNDIIEDDICLIGLHVE